LPDFKQSLGVTNFMPITLIRCFEKNSSLFQCSALLLSACFLIFIYPATGLDQILIAPYYDASVNRFPLKHHVFLEEFMHFGLKYCMVAIALTSLSIALQANIRAPFKASFFARLKNLVINPYFLAFIGMVISSSVVSILKNTSIHGCPNDLVMYGGNLPFLNLFEELPAGVKAGHCFPGGHASGGFALMAFYYAFRVSKPKFARAMLLISLVFGFAMGWAQMMRGEHFLSHNLWSAWVVWLVLFVLFTAKKIIEKN
jgi:membrane-associated PAP2 superfamily phosphatase